MKFAKKNHFHKYQATSALKGSNVEKLFNFLSKKLSEESTHSHMSTRLSSKSFRLKNNNHAKDKEKGKNTSKECKC